MDDPFESIQKKLEFPKNSIEATDPKSVATVDVLRTKLEQPDKVSSLLVIVKIVNGKATAEGSETRRRQRLALESAMSWAGYSMTYPGRMTYITAEYDYYHTPTAASGHKIDLPLKLYSKDIKATTGEINQRLVVVAWVRDEHLGEKPLNTIAQITRSLLDSDEKLIRQSQLIIAGPSYSDTLAKMNNEFDQSNASATVSNKSAAPTGPISTDLKSNLELLTKFKGNVVLLNSNCTAPNSDIGIAHDELRLSESKSIAIAQIIGEDELLVQSIRDELVLRGRTNPNYRTVLFVEEQSYQYINALRESLLGPRPNPNITVVPYLPGIAMNDPGGQSTSDYLVRTFADLRNAASESVVAVGVFGSRTADKIAIFRAARNVFPAAAYFTTEIDADYIDAKNFIACRNLLVASHFGLTINTKLFNEMQRKPPVFRDGYQTSNFLGLLVGLKNYESSDNSGTSKPTFEPLWFRPWSTGSANGPFGEWRLKLDQTALQPLVFEVSRSGFHQFKPAESKDFAANQFSVAHPISPTPLFAKGGRIANLVFLLIVVWAILMLFRVHSNGIRNALEQSRKLMRAVVKFVVAQFSQLFQAIKQSTDPKPTGDNKQASIAPQPAVSALNAPPDQEEPKPAKDQAPPSDEPIWFVAWFLMVCAVSAALMFFAWSSDVDINGEPVSLTNAISIWPSVFLFHVVSCASSYIVARSMSKDWLQARSAFYLAVALIFLIWSTLGSVWRDIPPARGELPRMVAYLCLIASAAWLFYLASLSSLNILRSRKEISDKLDKLNDHFRTPLEQAPSLEWQAGTLLKKAAEFRESLSEAMIIGERASITLIAPAALTIVLAMARLPLLDSWGLPRVWYAALMTPMVLSVMAALLMRSEARRLKSDTLERFEENLAILYCRFADETGTGVFQTAETASSSTTLTVDRERFNDYLNKVNANLDLIRNLHRGPFASVYSDPLLGGILLILTAGLTGPLRETTVGLLNYLPGFAT